MTSDKKSNQKIEGAIVIPDGTPIIIIDLEHENENEMVRVEISLGVKVMRAWKPVAHFENVVRN